MDRVISSVAQLCLTLCDRMDCSTPCFSVHHQLPELAQTHVHRGGEAIQPSHPLLSPSPPALSLFCHRPIPYAEEEGFRELERKVIVLSQNDT